jgi:hypothetical protein
MDSRLYERLNTNNIEVRLLKIFPVPNGGAAIEVKLFERPLNEAIKDGFLPVLYV